MAITRVLIIPLLLLNFLPIFAQQNHQTDICIYGATSAGIIAAYTASKMGKKVLLIEPGNHIGGLTTGGLGQTDIGNKYAITGISREFYRRIGKHYGKFEQWTFEPHVAEMVFKQLLDEGKIKVLTLHQLGRVGKDGNRIKEIEVTDVGSSPSATKTISASMFIDCTYEGDLMAMAGVSYTVGRESNQQYGETWNGVQLLNKHQFPDGVDPYKIPGKPESGLLWGISNEPLLPNGSADKKIQTYNFRLCLTNNPKNRIPISKPDSYDSTMYELLLRQLAAYTPDSLNWQLLHIAHMPNQKTDINNCGGFSSDMIGMNYDYVDADFKKRREIIKAHEVYTKGWLYFLGHDKRVPEHLRNEMLAWGYAADEYPTNNHFTPQLYIREARRMVGPYVMTQHNCEGREVVTDGIGMAAYTMDSHNCQRVVVNGMVKNEGDVQVGGFGPYPISYRAIVPHEGECANLVVPVCLSASHIAFGSIRMEPVFMVLAQSAAVAASLAIENKSSVQKVNMEKLQRVLKANPLADGSPPEILIDNDDRLRVQLTGNWINDNKINGRYGPSLSYSSDKNSSAQYTFPKDAKSGKYSVYLYCPSVKDVVRKMEVALQLTQKSHVTVELTNHRDEWVLLGQFEVAKGKDQFIQVRSAANEAGFIFADAVLFVPVRKE
jgi:FAD dependent oxidoreductase